MDIIGKRKLFLLVSGIVTGLSIVSIVLFGFKLSIDFTGGSRLELASTINKRLDTQKIRAVFQADKIHVVSIRNLSNTDVIVRTDTITNGQKTQVISKLLDEGLNVREKSFDTLGPTIGGETKNKAIQAVAIAIVAITLYIAFAFRQVSKPVSSWKFGVSAIIALVHDVVVVLGVFSLLGLFFGIEVDSLFITAVLTIMGFSVHDTIVVFDRIRENQLKNVRNLSFDAVVNNSFNETLARSLNTSLTVVLVLLALLLFGGESIRWFIVAFLVGIITGTYSSIFIASSILVSWYHWDKNSGGLGKLISRITPNKKKK